MGFKDVKYQTDAGTVVNIRVSDATIAAAGNTAVAAALDDNNIWAFASNPGSRRKRQLNARGVVLGRTIGAAPNSFVRKTFMPVFSKTALDAMEKDSPISLNGVAYTIKSKVEEA